jgi:Tol biopolymer transport system component
MKWLGVMTTVTGIACAILAIAAPAPPALRNGKIAFSAGGNIWTVNPDGTGMVQLTNDSCNAWSPAWSADGTRIAFMSCRDGGFTYSVYVMDADGANQVRLTSNNDEGNPTWSPDGTRVAFDRHVGDPAIWDIYAVDVVTGLETRLSDLGAQTTNPSWSPDGSRIAFTSTSGGPSGIFLMDADGSNPVRLTDQSDGFPKWSADGGRIFFARSQTIYVMDADGSHQRVVNRLNTGNYAALSAPSPDGEQIALDRLIVGPTQVNEVITITPFKGKPEETTVTPLDMTAGSPAWQPLPNQ